MKKQGHTLLYSPSDLITFMESPFASWMDRVVIENPDKAPLPDDPDSLHQTMQAKGYQKEEVLLEVFKSKGLSIEYITGENFNEKHKATRIAIEDNIDVIYQAVLTAGNFSGFADFLIKNSENNQYEIWDSKLSSSIKPQFVIQLCCYAEMAEHMLGYLPQTLVIAFGSNQKEVLNINDYYAYYQAIKQQFLSMQNEFDEKDMPDPFASKSYEIWSNYAQTLLKERDHLSLVANITRSQIKKLNLVGISTVKELANFKQDKVPGLGKSQFLKLQKQADIQVKSDGRIPPLYEVLTKEDDKTLGLALLPSPSSNDIFFDIEGYPLEEDGLEYLWGAAFFDEQGKRQFKDFWAHNSEDEKKAFADFIHWTYKRWKADKTMHIYHYANYEIAACRRLMGRYGVCEEEVDQLLRNEVFVDLYKIIKTGLRIGEPKYSIKNVEHLYRSQRETEVGTGSDSVAVYDAWRENPDGDTWQTSKILNDIREYNKDDCYSTQELTQWLYQEQQKHNISYIGQTEYKEAPVNIDVDERQLLRDKLLEKSQQDEQAQLIENLAWMLEFHQRENKPVFWRLFDRREMTEDELYDDIDCLAYCKRTDREPFKLTPAARNLVYEYAFDPNQEFKGGSKQYHALGYNTDEGKPIKLTFVPKESALEKGFICLQMKEEIKGTVTLIPDDFINPEPIPIALKNQIEAIANGNLKQSAIQDFLTRAYPRITGIKPGDKIVKSDEPKKRLKEIIQAIINLDNSYLPIQGPPGAGKSYTGKHIIAELLRLGKKVGISSNSHKAINNLLFDSEKYCRKKAIKGHFVCGKDEDNKAPESILVMKNNGEIKNHLEAACVIGTTAWGFARDDVKNEFDYLFIDEAGQVSTANLVAMSQSTKNIVLLGDQMQLGQPTQGTHPLDSGLSILDYLLKDAPTITADKGVFLETTYRMHSKVNQFISDAIYQGKLHADPKNDRQQIKVPDDYQGPFNVEAGIIYRPVEHEGNTQASDEEAAVIKKAVSELIGRQYTNKEGVTTPLSLEDMLFVTPYNHQKNKLHQLLGENVKVGTVDKFQGQQAPVVFFSLCTSDPSESPRGIDFLFDTHRINVAISRAQCMAVIVGNPRLFVTPVKRLDQMKRVNVLARLLTQ